MACDNLLTASLLQVVNKLQQAGKIDNLQQACGVFGCVVTDVQSLFIGQFSGFSTVHAQRRKRTHVVVVRC